MHQTDGNIGNKLAIDEKKFFGFYSGHKNMFYHFQQKIF